MKTLKTPKFLAVLLGIIFMSMINQINAQQTNKAILKGIVTESGTKNVLSTVSVILKNTEGKPIKSTVTGLNGNYEFTSLAAGKYSLSFNLSGYKTALKKDIVLSSSETKTVNIGLIKNIPLELVDEDKEKEEKAAEQSIIPMKSRAKKNYTAQDVLPSSVSTISGNSQYSYTENFNTEAYSSITENDFKNALLNPLSTFSIDVDAASYSNVRRFITNGQNPPADAVRIEEMINYFNYDYPQPKDEHPFSITTEMSTTPWNSKTKLVHIGLQGKNIDMSEIPASNLVFLVDVSGSMEAANKLPLLKKSFNLLVDNLRENDRVAIVVYAGAAGLVLPSTAGSDKAKILEAINNLSAGGSTAGGAGIKLAYKVAQENFIKNGNNRIILATDGDFNIGASSDGEMTKLIEEKRKSGVYLTCLGFGMGNYKDSKMETLADKGNGNYAYIDNILEAKKVLVTEMGGTLFTIAKDVKLQLEFNPNKVESYKLIGYENRLLNAEDFNDDTKDAGELGAGHTVTALYEIVLKGEGTAPSVDSLRYQKLTELAPKTAPNEELLTVKFRYKKPNEETSKLIVNHLTNQSVSLAKTSNNFRFSAAVAEFGLLLRNSKYKANANYKQVVELAKASKGTDEHGYRAEFIRLVEMSEMQASAFLKED
ncbi:MAG: von Willebrand factor type A domain-containing protein [Flavobacteriales bacterium]|nr:von Willebrand factor type A domain-containing protein [Flavobacteriales bacterium]MCL4856064.1 von Willebrand factor type A domain-containing protein [Flavobacteriales bacterium]